jgi:dethiobiotin synthetase
MENVNQKLFVTAIGTDSGKTLVSAILCRALEADYWKPVQAGVDQTDSETVKQWSPDTIIHPEQYVLKAPMSPHAAADLEGIELSLHDFEYPNTENSLIVEGAGGVLVPINQHETILDLILHLRIRVIVVSNFYLGSINHTLLTAEVLRQHEVPVAGIIFNGEENAASKEIILIQSNG